MDTDAQRKKLIQEREKYFLGEGKSYSWNDVKEMAMNKEKRNATIEMIESGYIKKTSKMYSKSFQFPVLYSVRKVFSYIYC